MRPFILGCASTATCRGVLPSTSTCAGRIQHLFPCLGWLTMSNWKNWGIILISSRNLWVCLCSNVKLATGTAICLFHSGTWQKKHAWPLRGYSFHMLPPVPRAIAFSIPALSPCKLRKEETEKFSKMRCSASTFDSFNTFHPFHSSYFLSVFFPCGLRLIATNLPTEKIGPAVTSSD